MAVWGALILAALKALGEILGLVREAKAEAPGNATVDEAARARAIDDNVVHLDMAALERLNAERLHHDGK